MKAIIVGQSTFENQLTVEHVEIYLKNNKIKITEIVSGDSKKDESIAFALAEVKNLPIKEFLINWDDLSDCPNPKKNRYGQMYNPQAGIKRNVKMAEYADIMIVFWDDISNNEYILSEMKKTGKPVYFAKPNPEYVF